MSGARTGGRALVCLAGVFALGCGSASTPTDGAAVADGDAITASDGASAGDGVSARDAGVTDDSAWPDAALPDGRVVHGPYASRVVSFEPGTGAGFGQSRLPDVVLGPPVGAGDMSGSTDVVSLGRGGRICVAFDDVAVVDGPGVDLIVAENPFFRAGSDSLFVELGEVSVSEDGQSYRTFACAPTSAPYTGCAGWHPVYSAPGNGIAPGDVRFAGGDGFDLADVGLARARYLCVRDLGTVDPAPPTTGFDLDAVTAVNYERN